MEVRDFAYPIHNSLHWGHRARATSTLLHHLTTTNYQARVIYPYEAVLEGEISVEKDDVIEVLRNLGNGWVHARRGIQCGLVPENYIQRVFKKF